MALTAGVMTITVEFAKGLKDTEWFGRQDPYCVLRVGTQTFRTNTALDAGRNPVWNEAFRAELLNENDVEVDIKDANLLEDGHIGRAAFSLARARECGSDQIQVPVVSRTSGRQHGVLAVALRWEPHHNPGTANQPYAYAVQPAAAGCYPPYPPYGQAPRPCTPAPPSYGYYEGPALTPQPAFFPPAPQPATHYPAEEVVEYRPPHHHHHHYHQRPIVEEIILVEKPRW